MLLRIAKRLSYTNVALTVAIVFLTTGGALAAGGVIITSKKQISTKVLKALQGKRGARGPAGPAGPAGLTGPAGAKGDTGATGPEGKEGKQGPQGLEGKEGPVGAKGDTGATGPEGKEGEPGLPGPEGQPWTPNNVLPANASETGTWTLQVSNVPQLYSISFPIKLSKGLEAGNVHVIGPEEGEGGVKESEVIKKGECKGTMEAPGAGSGNLCVFLSPFGAIQASDVAAIVSGGLAPGTGTTGAILDVVVGEAKGQIGLGTWAVTG